MGLPLKGGNRSIKAPNSPVCFSGFAQGKGPSDKESALTDGGGRNEASWSQGQRINILSWRAHCKSPWVTPWEVAISHSVLTTSLSQLPFFLLALALILLPQESSLYSWNIDIIPSLCSSQPWYSPEKTSRQHHYWSFGIFIRSMGPCRSCLVLSLLVLCQAHHTCLMFILLWACITEPNGYPHPIVSEYPDAWKVPKYFCTLDPVMKSPPPSL